jgi:rhodanese-related sulfurtransferase
MSSSVATIPAAASQKALAHFEALFEFETDCYDVYDSMSAGKADFVLLDVRSAALYEKGHVAGAISLPHGKIIESKLSQFAPNTLFITYCAGPHCNGAYRGAIRLAKLGRPVKVMIGGATGWLDDGYSLVPGAA